MEFGDILARRRMHRAFEPDAIPRDQVERIARTIRRAPSGGFSQGQSIVVVTDAGLRAEIGRLEAVIKAEAATLRLEIQKLESRVKTLEERAGLIFRP